MTEQTDGRIVAPYLKIEHLDVVMSKTHILEDIDFKVAKGEFFSLLGSSGCGKSTLLKTIAGIVAERTGRIFLNGKQIHQLPPRKRNVSMVFQDIRLFPNMTVGENVSYPLRVRGVDKSERKDIVARLLADVYLDGFTDKNIDCLSGGEKQRVAIARALASSPELLLLDEPFSALDENLREDMRNLVARIHKASTFTTIMVTHDQREALMMSDHIAVMSEGKILQIGTPEDIYLKPASFEIARYFSDGNIFSGTVEAGVFTSGTLSFPCSHRDGSYTAIIRDNAIVVAEGSDYRVESIHCIGQGLLCTLRSGDRVLRYTFPLSQRIIPGSRYTLSFLSKNILLFRNDSK
jgi:ABC-type Fe3+/spermidine/putrescine transport system ATPase subunit